MEPTHGKPPLRKRRRWLIVGLVLVLGSAWSWWYWPRIDERFVGKWKVEASEPDRDYFNLELTPDGMGSLLVRRNRSYVVHQFPWRVQGGTLVFFGMNPSQTPHLRSTMQRAYDSTKDPIFLGRERVFQIDRCDEDSIQLSPSNVKTTGAFAPSEMSLTRRPR